MVFDQPVFGHPAKTVCFGVGAKESTLDVGLDLLHQHILFGSVFRVGLDDDIGSLLRTLDNVGKGLHVCVHETLHDITVLGVHLLRSEQTRAVNRIAEI